MIVVTLVSAAFEVYFWLIIAHVIFSWIPIRQRWLMDIRDFVYRVTEPYLNLFRRFVPIVSLGGGGLDLSPWVALLILRYLIQPIAIGLLLRVPSLP